MIILNIMLSYVINVIFLESILILVKKLSSNYFDKNSYVATWVRGTFSQKNATSPAP